MWKRLRSSPHLALNCTLSWCVSGVTPLSQSAELQLQSLSMSLQLTPHYSPFLSLHLHLLLSFAPFLSLLPLNLHLSSLQIHLLPRSPPHFSFFCSHFLSRRSIFWQRYFLFRFLFLTLSLCLYSSSTEFVYFFLFSPPSAFSSVFLSV